LQLVCMEEQNQVRTATSVHRHVPQREHRAVPQYAGTIFVALLRRPRD
jgi:hypothetical protein